MVHVNVHMHMVFRLIGLLLPFWKCPCPATAGVLGVVYSLSCFFGVGIIIHNRLCIMSAFIRYKKSEIPVDGMCKIGRSRNCTLTIDENLVSREHAIIFFDATTNRWCISDLGSKNGTYVDGRRVGQVMALGNRAQIKVGHADLEFISTVNSEPADEATNMTHTIFDSRSEKMWLLLADIRNSTKLMQILPPGELQMKVHKWIDQCKPVLMRSDGQINEYVGDGFVAFWRERGFDISEFSKSLLDFEAMEVKSGVDFRMIVHYGEVMTGIGVSSSLEKLTGPTLNFMFKCEKAVRDAPRRLVFSEAAESQLKANIPLERSITCSVTGFDGEYIFYTLAGADVDQRVFSEA